MKLLENVTFQKDMGSYAKKSERVRGLAAKLAAVAVSRGATVDAAAIDEAAVLAKTDLTTELVKEFTELQGVIGGLYAISQGVSAAASDAIYDQYLPASAKDAIPRSAEGAILGLADRIDTIAGMFALGMEPTGSKDPFALRRAANAVVRILAESTLPLKLSNLFAAAEPEAEVETKLNGFFLERIDFYLREGRDQAYDVVKAVMAAGTDDVGDLVVRAEAVTEMRGSEDFLAVCAAFKRMKNILVQAQFVPEQGISNLVKVIEQLGPNDPQVSLSTKAMTIGNELVALRGQQKYLGALKLMATLRPDIDAFFDAVMIMDGDLSIRKARLILLAQVMQDFSGIADFSEVVGSS